MSIFKDKVAIVTGASRGIGFSIAKSFEAEGAKLVLTAKDKLNLLEEFKGASKLRLDLASKVSINNLVFSVIKEFGRIDILVNNAGVFKQTDFETISEAELDNIVDIDLKGQFYLLQLVFSQMKKQISGKIINVSSSAGKMGSSKAVHYAACKAAVISMTKSLAKLGGKYNINVNAVAPGFIQTDMTKDMLYGNNEFIKSLIPLNRIGLPEEVAFVVKFLASESSSYLTGQTICVDGGQCMV